MDTGCAGAGAGGARAMRGRLPLGKCIRATNDSLAYEEKLMMRRKSLIRKTISACKPGKLA